MPDVARSGSFTPPEWERSEKVAAARGQRSRLASMMLGLRGGIEARLSGRSRRCDTAQVDETLRALDLVTEEDEALAPVAERAFALALPATISERERRLLELAHEVTQSPRAAAAFRDATRSYLALAAASWAAREDAPVAARDAALAAAIAVVTRSNPNVRRMMGVDLRLRELAADAALDASCRSLAVRVAREERLTELDLYRVLPRALDDIERRLDRSASRRLGRS